MKTLFLPYDVARCTGVSYVEGSATKWREGCECCLRRIASLNPNPDQQRYIEPPPVIAFSCEYLLEYSNA